MTNPKTTHPFILKFREQDRRIIELQFGFSFRMNDPEVALANIETFCKIQIDRQNKKDSKFFSRLLETIKENRDSAKSFGELYARSD